MGHFRSIFHDNGSRSRSKSEMLRTLWREHPEATPAQIRAKLGEMGYRCAPSLVLRARSASYREPNKAQEYTLDVPPTAQYTLDEIRAVHDAALRVGGICRLAALVAELVELRAELLSHE